MIRSRYADRSKIITDEKKLQLTDETQVMIFRGDEIYSEVVVDLEERAAEFEKLKSLIVFIAGSLDEMDRIAQKYAEDSHFTEHYEAVIVYLDGHDRLRLEYWGMIENTVFDVIFQYNIEETENGLILKAFGMQKDIPPDWDKG